MSVPTAAVAGRKQRPACPRCGIPGQPLYQALRDRVFGTQGEWTMKRCPAPACGLLWLDPMPSDEDLAIAYRTYYTHQAPAGSSRRLLHRANAWIREGYYGCRFGYPVSSPAWAKTLLGMLLYALPVLRDNLDMRIMFLAPRPGGRLLDVGCGSGSAMLIMQQLGWQTEGVDLDPKAVETARALGVEAHVGTLESQRYPNASFDALMMSHIIEHVPDPAALMRESHRILKPGGRIGIVTPNAASRGHARFRERWRGLEPPRHLQVFTAGALLRVVEEAGFQRERSATSSRLAAMIRRESLAEGPESAARVRPIADQLTLTAAYLERLLHPESGEELLLVARR